MIRPAQASILSISAASAVICDLFRRRALQCAACSSAPRFESALRRSCDMAMHRPATRFHVKATVKRHRSSTP